VHPIKHLLFLLLALVSACAFTGEPNFEEEMYKRASALTKLSASMEALIRYGNPLARLSEAELLAEGTRHDPALLTNVGDYKIRVMSCGRHAVVLVCSKEGDRALLEDVGCTGKMDIHHWQKDNAACEFTVAIESVCGPA
jgi:hypothetical protein